MYEIVLFSQKKSLLKLKQHFNWKKKMPAEALQVANYLVGAN